MFNKNISVTIIEPETSPYQVLEAQALNNTLQRQLRCNIISFICPQCNNTHYKICYENKEEIYYKCSNCNYIIVTDDGTPINEDITSDNIFNCKGFIKNELVISRQEQK